METNNSNKRKSGNHFRHDQRRSNHSGKQVMPAETPEARHDQSRQCSQCGRCGGREKGRRRLIQAADNIWSSCNNS